MNNDQQRDPPTRWAQVHAESGVFPSRPALDKPAAVEPSPRVSDLLCVTVGPFTVQTDTNGVTTALHRDTVLAHGDCRALLMAFAFEVEVLRDDVAVLSELCDMES